MISKEILRRIIFEQNQETKENIIERTIKKDMIKKSKHSSISIITGIRRSGKSTLMIDLKNTLKEKYYINFDDERLILFELSDFEKLLEVLIELHGKRNMFFFDEIQNIKGWERFVRRLHDSGNKIYITGSNASMLSKELGTHLTGRYIQSELYPFSFKEYLRYKNIDPEKINTYDINQHVSLLKHFKTYMYEGGFPEYLKNQDKEFFKMLYENIIYRDVVVRYKLSFEKGIKDMLYFLISNISKPYSFTSLRSVSGISSITTIKEYIGYLENSYLIFSLPMFSYSLKQQLINPKKIYVIDTGLANSISFKFSEDQGRLLENLVFIELKRRSKEVYYHRDKGGTGRECDFVIKQGLEITEAIQVTTSLEDPETRKREISGLIDALKTYNLKQGLILTEDEEDEFTEKDKKTGKEFKIKVMPIWKFLLF